MRGRFSFFWAAMLMVNGMGLATSGWGLFFTHDLSFLGYVLLHGGVAGYSTYRLYHRAYHGDGQ